MKTAFDTDKDGPEKARLIRELNSINEDFKAGVVAAEIVEAGVRTEDVFFRNQSSFKRRTSKDIKKISWSEIEGVSTQLVFDLNREGIYDMLPEALLHTQGADIKAGQNQKKRNELKTQERQAREFFSPLENEFMHRALLLDTIGREIIKNNNPARNREFFEFFFGSSALLTDRQVLILLHILPLCHKIRGDATLIALAISRIIGYPVAVVNKWTTQKIALPEHAPGTVPNRSLGQDMVLNDSCYVPIVTYTISISGITAGSFKDFRIKGKDFNVISFIIPYLFPVDSEVEILLEYSKAGVRHFTVGTDDVCFLGFNAYI